MNIDLLTEPFNIDEFKTKVNDILYPFDIDLQNLIKDHSLDPAKVEKFITEFDVEYKDAIKYILTKIRHISWSEFKDNLFELANDIKKRIKGDYGFLLTYNTQYNSEAFFTSLVYQEVFSSWKEPVMCGFINQQAQNVIYVDDGSYSGIQLLSLLSDFIVNQKNIYSNKPTDFQVILLTKSNVDLPSLRNENDYFISININKNLYGFYSKVENKKYLSTNPIGVLDFKLLLQLMKDLNDFKKLHADIVYIKDSHDVKYLDVNKIKLLYNKINIWICIPYISEETTKKLDSLEKKNSKYFKIHYAKTTKYRLYNIIEDAPTQMQDKVIQLFRCYLRYYSNYLKQTEMNLKDIPIFPIYFDHKIASIISTLSVIIGCGVIVTPKDCKAKFVGPLIKNCELKDKNDIENVEKLIENLYTSYIATKSDNNICSICPKPIYKYRKEDIL